MPPERKGQNVNKIQEVLTHLMGPTGNENRAIYFLVKQTTWYFISSKEDAEKVNGNRIEKAGTVITITL